MVRDVKAVIEKKLPLYVVVDDLTDRGIPVSQLIPGVEQIRREGIARLVEAHDRILGW
jgi:hypothetical protein